MRLHSENRAALEETVVLLRRLGHEVNEREVDHGPLVPAPEFTALFLRGLHEEAAKTYEMGLAELPQEPSDLEELELRDQLEADFVATAGLVPALQKRMIRMARESNKFVITATQMMESMIYAPVPTRAEVSDVANAVLDGTDAVMLSAESAAGKYPVQTIETMAAICVEAEKSEQSELDKDFLDRTFTRIDQSIAMGALFTAFHLGAKAIVALTESGSTALWMSRHWTHVPIFALTPRVGSERAMAIYRNVTSLHLDTSSDRDTALQQALETVVSKGYASRGDMVVLTVGEPMGQAGGTNTLKIVRVGEPY